MSSRSMSIVLQCSWFVERRITKGLMLVSDVTVTAFQYHYPM